MCVLLYSLSGKDDFPVKKECGGTSSTQRFQKRTPEVHQKSNAFKSHNPSFTVSMRRSYINQNLLVCSLLAESGPSQLMINY